MPELPEVETTRRALIRAVGHLRLARVVVHDPRLRYPVNSAALAALAGHNLAHLARHGKYLVFHFPPYALVAHLGMTGAFLIAPSFPTASRHDRVTFHFETGPCIRFRDPRRFGLLVTTPLATVADHPLLRKLGPDPLEDDPGPFYLYQRARGRRRAIKDFLMDQAILAGIGNIYAAESLWRAAIHPFRAAGRISDQRYIRLWSALHQVLTDSIAVGGTTIENYLTPSGDPGGYRPQLAVYGRAGQPCPRCAQVIRRTVRGGRATFYCPRCQH